MSKARIKALEAALDGRKIKAALLCVEREFAAEADRRTTDDIAEEIGVSRTALYNWRTQDAKFIEYSNLIADKFLSGHRAFVYKQLLKTIDGEQPSVKGIDLFFRRHGLITEKSVVETKDAGSREGADLENDIADLDAMLADGSVEAITEDDVTDRD
jgi:transposase-like protein